jgi:hypothetical protein
MLQASASGGVVALEMAHVKTEFEKGRAYVDWQQAAVGAARKAHGSLIMWLRQETCQALIG